MYFLLCNNEMPNKEVSNDYDYKMQGKGTEPTININAIEIMEQKLPEYVMKYQSSEYDEIESIMESVIEKKFADNSKHNSFPSHAFEL